MKKVQLKMWKGVRKTVKHRVADQVVELKDDRSLFARMLIVARSRPEINLKESIGQHKFTSLSLSSFLLSEWGTPTSHRQEHAHGYLVLVLVG